MRKLFLVLAFLMLLNIAAGFTPLINQDTSSRSKSVNNGEEYTKIIRGNLDLGADAISFTQDDMNSKVRSFLSKNIPRFEIEPENLALSSSYIAQKSKGLSILKYTQEYDGLPVYSSRVIVAVQDGKIVTLKSEYYPIKYVSTKPALSKADTLEVVEKDMGVPFKFEHITKKNIAEKSSSVEDVLLVIYPEHTGTGIEYHLAYKIELGLIKSPPAKWTYIVDANNGEILEKYDRVVYSTLDGKVTGSVYPENINQTPVTKNFSNMTLYDYTTPETDVFWSGTGDDIDNYITTKNPINLSDVSSATLEFKIKYSIETDFDYGYASISIDGINYSIYETYTGIISNWTTREIDLSDFAGQQIWIRFNYSTDEAVQYEGMYIDDIKIETNTGTKFNDTGNSFANWDNIGFSIATQNVGSYALGNTSSNGSYSLSGLPGSFVLRYEFIGPYVHVNNYSGNDQYLNIDINTPSTQNIDWGTYDLSYNKEESNVFYHINRAHDFFIKGSPFDISSMNYQTIAYVQYTGTCNAFSDGMNVYFFGKGGGCEATSLYSDIIYHEYTHSVVDHVYTTTLPYRDESGALNEGWADYFASSINGNPCIAEGFYGDCLRNLTDIYRYPEDIMGEVHDDSRIVAGASWDLKQALGADIADALFINAMKLEPFNFSEYLDDIIVADDNNGNLADGTPHLFDICTAFYKNHGIYSSSCYIYYPVEPTVNLIENPGFESGLVNWTNYSSNGHKIITNEYSNDTHQGSWFAYMGNYNNANDYIYQDITIPSNANEAYVRFWYWISSTEKTTTIAYDQMKIEIRRPDNNTLLKDLGNLSNLNESYGFVISNRYDVSEFKGQTIRLKFNTTTDSSLGTAFYVDDTELMEVITVNSAPSIIEYGPSSPVGDTAGAARTFNITVNQTVNVTWTINGTTRQTNTSVTAASYTNASAAAGTWNVTASATNDNGTAAQSWIWTVSAVVENQPPVIASLSPLNVTQYNTTQFTVTATDPEGQSLFYAWDFNNDGVFEIGRSTTNTLYHTFSTNGTNTIQVHVDDGVVSTEESFNINVSAATIPSGNNNDPVIVSVSPVVVNTVGLSTLTISATDTDAGTTLYYAWDIDGDGAFESGRNTGNTISTTIDSTRVINVRVDDGIRVTTMPVTIAASSTGTNALPTFNAVTPTTATVNVPTTFILNATDNDNFPNAISYMVDADNSGTYDTVFVGSASTTRSTINQVNITFTTTGSHIVPVRVDDGVGIGLAGYFTVVVG